MITIVSAYYEFPSKHSHTNYHMWMRNFLGTVQAPILMFTTPEQEKRIREFRKDLPIVLVFLPIQEWEMFKYNSYWERDKMRDAETYHTIDLYRIWNEKVFFIERAIKQNPFGSSYFVWVDAGCFRNSDPSVLQQFKTFPSMKKLDMLPKNKITLLQMAQFQPEDDRINHNFMLPKQFNWNDIHIGGTIQVGHIEAWTRYIPLYMGMLTAYMRADYFTGKDQNLMATISIMYPEMVHLVSCSSAKYDPWFYLQEFLSDECA